MPPAGFYQQNIQTIPRQEAPRPQHQSKPRHGRRKPNSAIPIKSPVTEVSYWISLVFLQSILCTCLRLPCTFRGVSSLTDVAHVPYIADILTPYQIEAYKICYKNVAILFDSNESASFLRPIYEDVIIAFHEL